MKKLFVFFVVLSVSILFHSCVKEEEFDEKLLIGRWRSGTEFWVYESGHTGYTWDESDDVSEEDEKQTFTWKLVGSELQITHFGGKVPKYYTVIELSDKTLKYKDSFKSYSFSKVP